MAKTKRKKVRRSVAKGVVHIKASFNNTLITITDLNGDVLCWDSGGTIGYKGSKKGTPYAAQLAAADATRKAQNMGVSQLDIVIRGTGSGRIGPRRSRNICAYGNER